MTHAYCIHTYICIHSHTRMHRSSTAWTRIAVSNSDFAFIGRIWTDPQRICFCTAMRWNGWFPAVNRRRCRLLCNFLLHSTHNQLYHTYTNVTLALQASNRNVWQLNEGETANKHSMNYSLNSPQRRLHPLCMYVCMYACMYVCIYLSIYLCIFHNSI